MDKLQGFLDKYREQVQGKITEEILLDQEKLFKDYNFRNENTLAEGKEEFFNLKAKDIMTRNFTRVSEDSMAIDALELMENRESQISVLPVFKDVMLVVIVRFHDLLNVVGR